MFVHMLGFVVPTSIRLVSFNLWIQNQLFLHGFLVLSIYDICVYVYVCDYVLCVIFTLLYVIRTLFIAILFIFLYLC